MYELSKDQMEWGMEKLKEVSKKWDLPLEKTVQILSSRDQYYFYQWVNADLFLSIMENKYYNEKMEKNMKRRKPESWVGTNIFDTATSAINYYRDYGKNGEDVADMVHSGEIMIGFKSLRESYGDLPSSDYAVNGEGRFVVKI